MNRQFLTTLAALVLAASAQGAVTFVPGATVDWLTLGPGRTSLVDDNGAPAATLNVTTSHGTLLPSTPSSSLLNDAFWIGTPPALDSVLGNRSVSAIEFRVVPLNGLASYVIDISLARPVDLLVAVGQLYSDASSATGPVGLQSSGPAPALLGSYAWNDGLKPFDQDLSWDSVGSQLSPAAGAMGDSQVAFFVFPRTDRVTLSLPSAYGLGTGDSVHVAVGIIPEPSIQLLLAPSLLFLFRRRR